MSVTYSVRREDLWRGAFYILRHPQLVLYASPFLVIIALNSLGMFISSNLWRMLTLFLLNLLAGVLVFLAITSFQIWKKMPSAKTVRRCTESIEPGGFRCLVPEGERWAAWKDVPRIANTPHFVYLFAKGGKGYFVPKHAFANSAEADAFFQLATACRQSAKTGMPLPVSLQGAFPMPDNPTVWPPAPRI